MREYLNVKLAVFLMFISGVAMRFYHSASQSLWLDEAATYSFTERSFNYLITDLSFNDPHSPLYYIIVKCFTTFFGGSEFVLRLPSIIFGCLSLFAIYLLSRELFSRKVALVTMFLSLFNYYQIYYSQEARMYSMLVFFAVVSTYFLFRFIKTRQRKYLIIYILSTIVLGYIHAHSFFTIATHNIFVFYLYTKNWNIENYKTFGREEFISLKRWLIAQASIFLALLPWIYVLGLRAYNSDSPSWLPKPGFADILETYGAFFGYHGSAGIILLLIVLFISLGILSNVRDEENRPALLLMSLLSILPIIFPFVVSYIISPIYFPRYSIVASVPIIILVSKGIVDSTKKKDIYILVAFLFVLLSCIPAIYYYDTTKSEWDKSVQYVEDNISENESVILNGYVRTTYDYYSTRSDYNIQDKGTITNSSIKDIIRENKKLYVYQRVSTLKQSHKSLIDENYSLEKKVSYTEAPLKVYRRTGGGGQNSD